ncbi:DUF2653 family protein [Pseudomonas sp. IT-232MI5]
MSTSNKEQFDLMIRRILGDLIAACPAAVAITAEAYELPKGEHVSDGNGIYASTYYRESPEEKLLTDTLKWLREEGFIRIDNSYGFVATMQALKLASAVPKVISG